MIAGGFVLDPIQTIWTDTYGYLQPELPVNLWLR